MKSLRITITLIFALGSITSQLRADTLTISGPNLGLNIVGHVDPGLQFTALSDVTLDSFTFNNQGGADTLRLQDLSGNTLHSLQVSGGQAPYFADVDWSLQAGTSYRLMSTERNNGRWSGYSGFPVSNAHLRIDGTVSSSSLATNWWFNFTDIATTAAPPPPRLFTLCIGNNDGAGVRGDLDAQNVFNALKDKPVFAGTSAGNTASALTLNYSISAADAENQIRLALDTMQVTSRDTLLFYFSGHGGSLGPSGDETPVTIGGQPDAGDEFLEAGNFYLTDDLLAQIFVADAKWTDVRKVFLLDACFSGGFLGDDATADTGDLEQLRNYAFLAAADEDALSYSTSSGLGLWTEHILLPELEGDGTLAQVSHRMLYDAQHTLNDLYQGATLFLRDINAPGSTGTFSYSPTFSASADFDLDSPVVPTPEPSALLLCVFGALGLLSRRHK